MQIQINEKNKELKHHGQIQFPILVSYEQLSTYPTGSFIWHWHPEIEITLVLEGEILYRIQDKTYLLTKGNILFGNVNTVHTGKMNNGKDGRYVSITFDPRLVYGFKDSLIYTKYVQPVTFNRSLSSIYFDESTKGYKELYSSVNEIINQYNQKEELWEINISNNLKEIWKLIYQKRDAAIHNNVNQKDYERIGEIVAFLTNNYMKEIKLDDVAKAIHLCKGECSKLFKKCMKISLFSYLQEYRIEKSIDLLPNQDYSISYIAEQVGFSTANYYIKVFKKYKGCSPLKYRKTIEAMMEAGDD